MGQPAAIPFNARPAWLCWNSILPGRNHYRRRAPNDAGGGRDIPLLCRRVSRNVRDGAASDNVQPEVVGVFREVFNELVSGEIGGEPARDAVMREARKPAHGMQVQPIVSASPRSANTRILLEHENVDAFFLERCSCRQT